MVTTGGKTKGLVRMVTANIKNYNANKIYLQHLLQNFDIVCIQEHWLFNFEKSSMEAASDIHACHAKSIDDLEPVSPFQRPRGYGGIATFSPKGWTAMTKHIKDGDHRIIVLTINLPGCHLCIVNCYLPCRGYGTSVDDYKDCLII
jgi:exonuclease III